MTKLIALTTIAGSLMFGAVEPVKTETNTYYDEVAEVTETDTSTTETTTTTDEEESTSFDIQKFLEKYLSAETVTTIMSILTSLAIVLKLASSLKSLAKDKSLTTQDVCDKVTEALQTTNKESVNQMLNDVIEPLQLKVDEIEPVLNSFAKILVLSQEDTAESKLAILDLIQSMGSVSNTLIENAKTEVKKQQEEEEQAKKDATATLDTIAENNSNTESIEADSEGRY